MSPLRLTWWLILAVAGTLVPVAQAAAPALLEAAVANWNKGKAEWAFTVQARELDDDGRVVFQYLARYDPSRPDNERWQLIELYGKAATDPQRLKWEKSRNSKPRKKAMRPPEEYLDLARATVESETPQTVSYLVPLRSDASILIQEEKLVVRVTVGRAGRTVERVTVGLRDPMRVALGLAKITEIDFDVRFDREADDETPVAGPEPKGGVRVAVTRLGSNHDYELSDFRRVSAYVPPAKK